MQEARLFGTSGVRGDTNTEVSPSFAVRLSEAFGIYLGKGKTVAVGRDTRYGARMLQYASMSALASVGIHVENCGCVPIGALCTHVKKGADGGFMVTGSHMPYHRIGLIPLLGDGSYVGGTVGEEIEEILSSETDDHRVSPEEIGKFKDKEIMADYLNTIVNMVDIELIEKRRFNVLVDACNGTASGFLTTMLKKLNCHVVGVNDTQKPKPERSPEPRAATLEKTATLVVKNKCDFGVALDVDADRAIFIDKKGNVVPEDIIGAVFATETLKGGGTCVVPVNSSSLMEHVCARLNAKLYQCRIGQPAIIKEVRTRKANFAYEESGKYYFPPETLWSDGLLSTLKLLEILTKRKQGIETLIKAFPTYYQQKSSVPCADEDKEEVMENVSSVWETNEKGRVLKRITVDGIKHTYSDYSWLMIRASGTEPLIRLYAEGMSGERAKELMNFGIRIVQKSMKMREIEKMKEAKDDVFY